MHGLEQIIIVGKGQSKCLSPMEKQEGEEVWGVTDVYKSRYVDRTFDIHCKDFINKSNPRFKEHMEIRNIPNYTLEHMEIRNNIRFPIEQVMLEFGYKFFLNSICYMIAYAIMQKPKRIQLYGVDMRDHFEYIAEKGCMEFWLGVAFGRGIEVATNPFSTVLNSPVGNRTMMYAYETIDFQILQ